MPFDQFRQCQVPFSGIVGACLTRPTPHATTQQQASEYCVRTEQCRARLEPRNPRQNVSMVERREQEACMRHSNATTQHNNVTLGNNRNNQSTIHHPLLQLQHCRRQHDGINERTNERTNELGIKRRCSEEQEREESEQHNKQTNERTNERSRSLLCRRRRRRCVVVVWLFSKVGCWQSVSD